ncbi:ATP-binding cassette domain-containing protein [Haloimpatiens sp. FM7315]|uniref:ABC transporter ATP-binding protein n=1 Tax=Haloimpatiens sp. FM7315 TaxID=3298609 RepID=UPI0035A2C71C
MSLLEFKNVCYEDQGKSILKDINLDIEEGDFVSLVGPSGSGKSTLLKLCNNLISPSGGTIYYKGKSILEYDPIELRKNISYCFQMPFLFGSTIKDNIVFPYYIRNLKVDKKRTEELLSLFQFSSRCIEKSIDNLSGGERQRIALVRTLLFKPEVLLLDEVTSALDKVNVEIVEDVIKSLNQEGITVISITHNLEQAKRMGNKLLTIENGKIISLEVLR